MPRPSVVVVDTSSLSNVVALHLVDRRRVPLARRERILARVHGKRLPHNSAFEYLWEVFASARRRMVTSNVLQELWKARLPDLLGIQKREFVELAVQFQAEFRLEEPSPKLRSIWRDEWLKHVLVELGVTDAGLCWAARDSSACLLTEDGRLASEARANALEVTGASVAALD